MSEREANLVQRAKDGDRAAFSELYNDNYQKIYKFIYFRVNDTHLAEDLTSEVFVRLVKSIGKFNYQGKPIIAWLYTIAGNIVRDHYRKANRVQLMPIEDREVVSDEDPTEPLDLSMLGVRLFEAIEQLTPEQAQVILLKFVEGKRNKEIAEIMGKEEGSIKSLQHRALRSLRRKLEELPEDKQDSGRNDDEQ